MTDTNHPQPETDPAGEHPRFLAHHFESHQQQFDSGKLGMWIFLLTEVLLFGGLFCAYAVYRANHPEIFSAGAQFLDKYLGALNTCVLLLSSLTMAWGVRCAQLNQRRGLILCLVLTLACAVGFLGIKYVEYEHKWKDGLLWARSFDPGEHATETQRPHRPSAKTIEQQHAEIPRRVGVFFSIYFAMTGLHAIHVVAGMIAIGWVLRRSIKGHFNRRYFGPVDYVGLYWHLVDMIWIFLFPLLYLID